MADENKLQCTTTDHYSGALHALKARARGAPLIRDFGKPISARKIGLVMTSLRPTARPPVRTYAPPCKPM